MTSRFIRSLTLHTTRVSHKTCWSFVEIRTRDGRIGFGEATLTGHEDRLLAAAERLVPQALETSAKAPGSFSAAHAPADLPQAAIVCGIDQALWDLHAQEQQLPLALSLGAQREQVPVYANINRRTELRTSEGFVVSARAAMAAGFDAFKLAPFDEVNVNLCAQGQGRQAMQAGLARVAAVRAAVGSHARLMVDCHWRFDEGTARLLIEAAAEHKVHWIECPVPEEPSNIPALVRLRKHANGLGMRLAGLEECIRWETFRPYCEAGAYDVVMPDIKYAGGILEMLRIAQNLERQGIQISPHNPSGPICHAASLHFSRATAAFDMLEVQFDESPLFDALVNAAFSPVSSGQVVPPQGPGLAVSLNAALLSARAERAPRTWVAS